ncbi:MAG: hypothetical protein ACLQIQ_10770 [Beijerinckiaceae bacterium]
MVRSAAASFAWRLDTHSSSPRMRSPTVATTIICVTLGNGKMGATAFECDAARFGLPPDIDDQISKIGPRCRTITR